jgi:hypothetical protein
LQEIVVLTSKIRTRLGIILTSKGDHLFSSFGITPYLAGKSDVADETMLVGEESDLQVIQSLFFNIKTNIQKLIKVIG